MDRLQTACGLDIGSNTFSCALLSKSDDGSINVTHDTSIAVRLSADLRPGGQLHPAAIERGLEVLSRLADDFDFGEQPLRAVATQVLRMAADPQAFTVPAAAIIGTAIEIIDGENEALLAGRGAVLGLGAGPWVAVDVGGQSTELCWRVNDGWQTSSLPLGVVGLSASHLHDDPPTAAQMRSLRAAAREVFDLEIPNDLTGEIVAVAGTATSLGLIHSGLSEWRREKIHGLVMTREQLNDWLVKLTVMPAADRAQRYRIEPLRADVFPAGLCILDEVLERTGRDRFTISAGGLRVGVALSLLQGDLQ